MVQPISSSQCAILYPLRSSGLLLAEDNGTDVRFIQELLGHKDIQTTLTYTYMTPQSLQKSKARWINWELVGWLTPRYPDGHGGHKCTYASCGQEQGLI